MLWIRRPLVLLGSFSVLASGQVAQPLFRPDPLSHPLSLVPELLGSLATARPWITEMPKVTRLGDPANPYTKKKVTAAEAAQSRRMSELTTPKKSKKSTSKPHEKKPGLLDRAKDSGKKPSRI